MTNNSGKFVSTVSNKETELAVTEIAAQIPATPGNTFMQHVEEYFGRYWWLWLALLLIVKFK